MLFTDSHFLPFMFVVSILHSFPPLLVLLPLVLVPVSLALASFRGAHPDRIWSFWPLWKQRSLRPSTTNIRRYSPTFIASGIDSRVLISA